MKILVSAPLDFIDPKIIESFNKIEIIANECKTLQSVNELDKMSISGWMVNPCPEYHISKSIISQFMDLKVIVSPSTGYSY